MSDTTVASTLPDNISSDYRDFVQPIIADMLMREANGVDIDPVEITTMISATKAENAYLRSLVVKKHKLIPAADFDRMVRNRIISDALGKVPETATEFLEIVANRRSMVVHYSGAISQKPDPSTPFNGGTMGEALAMIAENPNEPMCQQWRREMEVIYPRHILRTEFETELRVIKDNLGLKFLDSQIKDAATLWVTAGKKTRVFDIAEGLGMEPGVPTLVAEAAGDMWQALAQNVFDTSEMTEEHVIAVLKKFIWSTKRKLAGLQVTNHLMPVVLGPQGSGKSTFVLKFVAPLAELMATTDFDQITDKRNIDLWKNYVLFLDEMAHAQRADIDAVKNAITAPTLSRRPMRENSTEIVAQNATFIGCSNKELSQLVNDTTGNRRFFPLRMPATACRDTVNLIDAETLWRSVDLHAADPMNGFEDQTVAIQANERSLSSVEKWLADFNPKGRHGIGGETFEELVRGNRIGANELFRLFSAWEAVHHPGNYRLNVQNFGSEMNRLMKNSPAAVPFKRGPRTAGGNTYEYTGQTVLKVVV